MAQRRMLNQDIIFSDAFLRMNNGSQALYVKLLLSADDEGFVSNSRMFVKRQSVLDELIECGFVYRFDSGVLLIRHWYVHNRIRKDTFKPTIHIKEKALVTRAFDDIYHLVFDTEP